MNRIWRNFLLRKASLNKRKIKHRFGLDLDCHQDQILLKGFIFFEYR